MDRVPARVKAALALLLGAFGSTCYADDASKPVYSKRTDFRLPVQISEFDRAQLRELKLFVRQVPGNWVCKETAPPTQSTFAHRVTSDGEYWFTFVSVDQAGTMFPADLRNEPPGLKVIVDTVAPNADVHPVPVANGEVVLKCIVKDANPDFASLKLDYQDASGKWTPLELLGADTPGIFRVPDARLLKSKVRVYVADLAGNSRNLEFDLGGPPTLKGSPVTVAAPPQLVPVVPVSVTPPATPDVIRGPEWPRVNLNSSAMLQPVPTPAPKPTPLVSAPIPTPAPLPSFAPPPPLESNRYVPMPEPVPMKKVVPMPMMAQPRVAPAPMPVVTQPAPAPIPTMAQPQPVPAPLPMVTQSEPPLSVPTPSINVPKSDPVPPPKPLTASIQSEMSNSNKVTLPAPIAINPGEVQVLNTTRFALDYAVDEVRPGSPARVEFWATKDRGRSWERLADKGNARSPAELHLPGDGLYGVALRVVTGQSTSPVPGENPDFWLEVDTTKPVASLLPPTVGTGPETGSLMILWTASDRGLQPEPISLYHASSTTGPWTPIARGIRNDGFYRWTLPTSVGSHVFLRLEVTDRAGNVTRVDSKTAVPIDPKSKIRVLGVTPAQMPGLDQD